MEIAFPCIHGSVGPAALIPWGMQNYLGPTRLLGFYLISRASPSSQGATQCKPKLFTSISNIAPPGLLFYSTQKDCYSNYLEPARAARDPEVVWFTQQASQGAIFSSYLFLSSAPSAMCVLIMCLFAQVRHAIFGTVSPMCFGVLRRLRRHLGSMRFESISCFQIILVVFNFLFSTGSKNTQKNKSRKQHFTYTKKC